MARSGSSKTKEQVVDAQTEYQSENDDYHSQEEEEAGSQSGSEEESVEEIDITDDRYYQVFSALFEDEEGNNVAEILNGLRASVDAHTQMMEKLCSSLDKIAHYTKASSQALEKRH